MIYTILEIEEPDFGCEGLPDGAEPMCRVVLQSESGEKRAVQLADALLYARDWDVGSVIPLEEIEILTKERDEV